MSKFGYSLLVSLLSSLLLPQLLFSQASSLHGIDLTDLDRKADPCNDFYEFANGTWRAKQSDSGIDGPLEQALGGGRVFKR